MKSRIALVVAVLALGVGITARLKASGDAPAMQPLPDSAGAIATFTSTGTINFSSAFFQDLGTNGRTCASCHQQSDAWSVSAEHIRDRFNATLGSDPIFRPVDGAVCPTADVSTVGARQKAYRLLISKGLIRVRIGIPGNAEFSLVSVDDPYHCATASNLSLYRRPLPATNLRFLSAVMWDGRETVKGQPIPSDLLTQAA